jgi:hypothetical protein
MSCIPFQPVVYSARVLVLYVSIQSTRIHHLNTFFFSLSHQQKQSSLESVYSSEYVS